MLARNVSKHRKNEPPTDVTVEKLKFVKTEQSWLEENSQFEGCTQLLIRKNLAIKMQWNVTSTVKEVVRNNIYQAMEELKML